MAGRTYTVQQLIDRAMKKADMYNSGFIDAQEQLDTFNEAYTDLYDILIETYANYFVTETTFSLVPGQQDYNLPSDHYKTIGFDYQVGVSGQTNQYIMLKPFNENERMGVTGITASIPSGTIRHRYVPEPKLYTLLSDTVDGISGWEELVVVGMAIEFSGKEESSTSRLERRYDMLKKRIQSAAQVRDVGFPGHITDTTRTDMYRQLASVRYQLNQGIVRLLTTEVVTPLFFGIYS